MTIFSFSAEADFAPRVCDAKLLRGHPPVDDDLAPRHAVGLVDSDEEHPVGVLDALRGGSMDPRESMMRPTLCDTRRLAVDVVARGGSTHPGQTTLQRMPPVA
jgi:hypothetical protein